MYIWLHSPRPKPLCYLLSYPICTCVIYVCYSLDSCPDHPDLSSSHLLNLHLSKTCKSSMIGFRISFNNTAPYLGWKASQEKSWSVNGPPKYTRIVLAMCADEPCNLDCHRNCQVVKYDVLWDNFLMLPSL